MILERIGLAVTLLMLAMAAHAQSQSTVQELPAPVAALQQQGIRIVGDFETAAGLHAYAGVAGSQSVAIYVVGDGQYAIVGSLIDGGGNLVSRDKLQELVAEPMSKRTWSQLENSTWVADGEADAPRIVYEFSDPNCPFCHKFWQQSRPWVESGKVQIRHVMVGVISETSANKVATILTADNPEQMNDKNQRLYAEGGIMPMEDIPASIQDQLQSNLQLMQQLGIRGTPGIVYKDDQGQVQIQVGLPRETAREKILGER